MKRLRSMFVAAAIALLSVTSVQAQEAPKPGPEHEMLKKWEGTWDVSMKMGDMEAKGTSTYKMELGGLWLASSFECELFGSKFTGKGMDSYDAGKKKFVAIWVDSMSTSPMVMEGTYDKETKKMTLVGEGPGEGGKTQKVKSVTEWKDENTANFTMYMGETKEPTFTIVYKRKK